MPRPAKGPRLFLRKRAAREAVWVILDTGGIEIGTGCSAGDRTGAEKALAGYLEGKHATTLGETDPRRVNVADVLAYYSTEKQPAADADARALRAAQDLTFTIERLIEWWGSKTLGDVKASSCKRYVRERTAQKNRRGGDNAKPIAIGTARRELEILRASIGVYHAEYLLDAVPVVTLPERGASSRKRWLTRTEAAAALLACMGWRFDGETFAKIPDKKSDSKHSGGVRKQVRTRRAHLRRFLISGWYTGTRHMAIVRARWVPSTMEPYIDVDRGLFYRRGDDERQTSKRQPPVRLPPKLLAHLRRWRAIDMAHVDQDGEPAPITHVIHINGQPLTGRIRTAWEGMRDDAGLGAEVVPHILRHTSATWAMQGGMNLADAADYLGMTEEVLRAHYYHFHPDFQAEAGDAFDRSRDQSKAIRAKANKTEPAQDTPKKPLDFPGQKENKGKLKPRKSAI